MAADWIKIEHGLPTKPEVMEMADVLSITDNEVVGLLVRFWVWVDENLSPECPAVPGTLVHIDRVVGRDGFANSLQSVGWLTAADGTIAIPNYEHHLSQSAKRRGVEAKKKRTQRTKMSRSCPDAKGTQQGTREEKRREESKEPPKSPKGDGAFDAFWQSVHLKTGKVAARRAHAKAVKRVAAERQIPPREAATYILDRMQAFSGTPRANPPDRTAIHPATWLSQGCYDDDPATWDVKSRPGTEPAEYIGQSK